MGSLAVLVSERFRGRLGAVSKHSNQDSFAAKDEGTMAPLADGFWPRLQVSTPKSGAGWRPPKLPYERLP